MKYPGLSNKVMALSVFSSAFSVAAAGSVPPCVVVRTPAKLNLFLELLGKRPDGFHDLETVMVPVGCFDTLRVARTQQPGEIRLQSTWWPSPQAWRQALGAAAEPLLAIPDDASNLIHRALAGVIQAFSLPGGFEVSVRKRIPAGAGMGGASSDAAAAIAAAAVLAGLDARDPRLLQVAERIGSDVPFFLGPAGLGPVPAVATGRGERLRAVPLGRPLWFVIGYPRGGLSTAAVYQRAELPSQPVPAADCLAALARGDLDAVQAALLNRLAAPAQTLSPQVGELLDLMQGCGMRSAMMTGSGSACFAIFAQRQQAEAAAGSLRQRWAQRSDPGPVLVVSSRGAKTRVRTVSSVPVR